MELVRSTSESSGAFRATLRPEDGDALVDPTLATYRATRRHGAREGWHLSFDPMTGMLRLPLVDAGEGLSSRRAAKARSVADDVLEDAHAARIRTLVVEQVAHLEGKRGALLGGEEDPDRAGVATGPDAPHLGFEWTYQPAPVARHVLPESSIAGAGLRRAVRAALGE